MTVLEPSSRFGDNLTLISSHFDPINKRECGSSFVSKNVPLNTTPLQCHTPAIPHPCNTSPPQYYTPAIPHLCNTTPLQYHTSAIPHPCNTTPLRHHTPFNRTAAHAIIHAACRSTAGSFWVHFFCGRRGCSTSSEPCHT